MMTSRYCYCSQEFTGHSGYIKQVYLTQLLLKSEKSLKSSDSGNQLILIHDFSSKDLEECPTTLALQSCDQCFSIQGLSESFLDIVRPMHVFVTCATSRAGCADPLASKWLIVIQNDMLI